MFSTVEVERQTQPLNALTTRADLPIPPHGKMTQSYIPMEGPKVKVLQ
jgi:hypothetical protein